MPFKNPDDLRDWHIRYNEKRRLWRKENPQLAKIQNRIEWLHQKLRFLEHYEILIARRKRNNAYMKSRNMQKIIRPESKYILESELIDLQQRINKACSQDTSHIQNLSR